MKPLNWFWLSLALGSAFLVFVSPNLVTGLAMGLAFALFLSLLAPDRRVP